MGEYLFVYGLLLRGMESHGRLDPLLCRFEGEATVSGKLYDLGPYPALRIDEPGTVHGELYEITDPAIICELDEYEGYHGRDDTCRYIRREVPVQCEGKTVQAWVYAYNPRRTLTGAVAVESGEFRKTRERASE